MLHEMRMNENTTDEFEVEIEEYEEVLKRFKGKSTNSYDFLTRAWDKYQEAMGYFPRRLQEDSPPNDLERERACRST